MVAKIGHGENIIGALSYNQLKVQKQEGKILFMHKMMETFDGDYSVAKLARSFEPYLMANRRTEKPVLHISLNPDPKDKVSDEGFKNIAQEYMRRMGYGNQPFAVFKHTDIERTHIHVVSVCVDEQGRKITDTFERRRSMDICRALEQQYNLVPATEQRQKQSDKIFQSADYKAGDIRSQIASVVRYLPKYYQFQNLGGYNALLSLFNITSDEVKGELHGRPKEGLVYFALNGQGEKASNPFKASLFGKNAGYAQLQSYFEQSKENLKNHPAKALLKNTIEISMHTTSDEKGFKKQLLEQGINTVVRRNTEGRVYGITFIDHTSKTVWNGSHFGKDLSAGVFHDWWNNGNKPEASVNESISTSIQHVHTREEVAKPSDIFGFLGKEEYPQSLLEENRFVEALGGLLPESHGEDYEELEFENRMKKKKRRKKQ